MSISDYREAINEVTEGAVPKLQKYLENWLTKQLYHLNPQILALCSSLSTEKKAEDDFDNFEKEVRESTALNTKQRGLRNIVML